jgi:transcriptional regulator with XRE-family HTH domain|tara:strand:+ start:7445 stop:7624 length:180 start_codon:yes stop_codon:yes gene_type:complete
MPDGIEQKLVEWTAQGLTDKQMAEKLGVNPRTLAHWRKRLHIIKPSKMDWARRHYADYP